MKSLTREDIDWSKGLIPVVVQDNESKEILMVGFMNEESFSKTLEIGKVTFYSRSKERLWTKGESSGNFLEVIDLKKDCDNDAIIAVVKPKGPICHTGRNSCFDNFNLNELEQIISNRAQSGNSESYTKKLLEGDEDRLIQKVGEEAVEVVIACKQSNENLINEMADLFYHSLVLLKKKGLSLADVEKVLEKRH